MRELKRYLDTATATVGLVVSPSERAVYWLDGHSLGILGSTGTDDNNVDHIGGKIRQLDHVAAVDLTVNANYDTATQRASTGAPTDDRRSGKPRYCA